MKHFKVTNKEAGERLDKYLVTKLGKISRSSIKEMIDAGRVKVNGKRVIIAKWETVAEDDIEVRLGGWTPKAKMEHVKGERKRPDEERQHKTRRPFIKVVYNDRDILVVEKPVGFVIQASGKRDQEETYVDHLRSYLKKKYRGSGSYVTPVHRLDKDTSGLMVFATSKVGERLVDQFKNHKVERMYLALTDGAVDKESGEINLSIKKGDFGFGKRASIGRKDDGARALTRYLVKERYEKATLLRLDLRTGRTHQARVHLAAIHHPIIGDHVYGKAGGIRFPRQALHSHLLTFVHPGTGKKMTFKSELPEDMAALVDELRGN